MLDLFFDVSTNGISYDFWSVKNDVMIYLTVRKNFKDSVREFLDRCKTGNDSFIPYDALKLYETIEVEASGIGFSKISDKYPLVCLRGICDFREYKEVDTHCMRKVCINDNRLDVNCWSRGYPEQYDIYLDIADIIKSCDIIDAFVIMFRCTPNSFNPELDFGYVASAIQIQGRKIKIITGDTKIRKMYEHYNKKYVTQDRQIEESISEPEYGFYFKF